jgi:hypothetical protein
MALSRTAQCSSCRWGMWTSGCTRWRCCCAPCTRPGPSSLGKDMSPTALGASSQRRPLTSRTRTDRHREVEALARGRVEEVEPGVAIDRELGERGPRGRGTRAVLAAREARPRRAHARGTAPGAAPRAPGVVRGERERLRALGREREAARQCARAQHAGEEHGGTRGPGSAPEVPGVTTNHCFFWWSDWWWWFIGGPRTTSIAGGVLVVTTATTTKFVHEVYITP